jgi:crotonobetaine/carnitine-CoA ligase
VPSPLGEEEVMAVLVVVPGTELTMESLFEHCATRLPYYAMPRYVEVAGELPKNAVNRVMKHLLREQGVGPHTVDLEALGLSVARTDRRS